VALTIPAIRVQTALLELGLNPDGSLQVPPHGPHYGDAGWYRYSPTPGSVGPSVIVGHVDSAHGGPSVFFHLADLLPGDEVQVSRADGSVATFTVDAVVRYHKAQFPTASVYSNTDYAALRLITCGGPIDPKTHHYRDNTVVFATMVSASPSPSTPQVVAG
jgi:sortase (surface protein transpeptidase)